LHIFDFISFSLTLPAEFPPHQALPKKHGCIDFKITTTWPDP